MRYLGGKHRQGKMIAKIIAPHIKKIYIEPFCGAMGSATAVAKELLRLGKTDVEINLSDSHEALITTWNALLNGWNPPDFITEKTYKKLKKLKNPKNPLTGYAGFGVAFAGGYFGTYARDRIGTDFSKNCKKSCHKKIITLGEFNISVTNCDYNFYSDIESAVFYLDPPYKGRTKQSKFLFNHDEFWDFARKLSLKSKVFITEFIAPEDFTAIYNWGDTVVRHYSGTTKGDGTVECMWVYNKGLLGSVCSNSLDLD